jgi:hypothetical protein
LSTPHSGTNLPRPLVPDFLRCGFFHSFHP